MTSAKTATLMLRLDPAVKRGLQAIAARERRSLSNMIEVMILDYGQRHGGGVPKDSPAVLPHATARDRHASA